MAANYPFIALALGGGAAKGLAHIGVLKALEEAGIHERLISGTSMGSIIGGLYASGFSIKDLERAAREVTRARTLQLFRPAFSSNGLVEDRRILKLLQGFCGEKKIEDLPIPFVACAVDFRCGKTVYIDSGPLIDAIRASIAIPGVFKPLSANDTLLVDGGLVHSVPLEILRRYHPDRIIGVNVLKSPFLDLSDSTVSIKTSRRQKEELDLVDRILHAFQFSDNEPTPFTFNLRRTALQSVHIMLNALIAAEVDRVKPEMMIEPDTSQINLWEFWKGKEAVEIGYRAARKALKNS